MTNDEHPERLPFKPEGMGWTEEDRLPKAITGRALLLTETNLKAVENNHPTEWGVSMTSLIEIAPKTRRDRTTGRPIPSYSEDEMRRLVALKILVDHKVVNEKAPEARTPEDPEC